MNYKINFRVWKKHLIVCLLFKFIIGLSFASDGLPKPISSMTFKEYHLEIVSKSLEVFESREQLYRTLHLTFQVLAVILSSLIPILLSSISAEKRKKKIITLFSIIVAVSIGLSNIMSFKQQSVIYGTGSTRLRKNFSDYETDKGVYEQIKENTAEKLKTYKYLSEEIIYETRNQLIETSPEPYRPTNK